MDQERASSGNQTAEREMECLSASVYDNMRQLLLYDPKYSKEIKSWSADEWYALYLEFGHVREAALKILPCIRHCGTDTLLGLYASYKNDAGFRERLELCLVRWPITELTILQLINDHPIYFTQQLDELCHSHTSAFSEQKPAAEARLSLEKLFTAPARLETMSKISRVVEGIFGSLAKAERDRPGLFDSGILSDRKRYRCVTQLSLRLPKQNYTPLVNCELLTYKIRANSDATHDVYQITYKYEVHYGVVRQSASKDDSVFRPPRTIRIIENNGTPLEGDISFWGCWDSPCYIGLPHHSDTKRPLSELEALITLADLNCMFGDEIKWVDNEILILDQYPGD